MRDVIEAKARAAYALIQTPVLVDDASLSIDDLGGLPGALVRWFITAIGNEGLCRLADQSETRKATARVAIGYYDGKEFVAFVEEVHGTISTHPEGEGGYGWDAIFIHNGHTVTRSSLSPEEYDKASIRRPALESLHTYLQSR